MPEYTPLTKEERERLVALARAADPVTAEIVFRYEATVAAETKRREEAEAKFAALESQLAELRRLAEVGKAVEGMPLRLGNEYAIPDSDERSGDPVVAWVSLTVQKGKDGLGYVWFYDEGNRQGDELLDAPRRGPTPLAALAATPLVTTGVASSEGEDDATQGGSDA